MPSITREYKDLDLNFEPHAFSGDLVPLTGVDCIKRSIKNLLLTNFYEKPNVPKFGSGLTALLFELATPLTKYALKDEIIGAIQAFEPRAKVYDVLIDFDEDNNKYIAEIQFSVENITEVLSFTVFLERVR